MRRRGFKQIDNSNAPAEGITVDDLSRVLPDPIGHRVNTDYVQCHGLPGQEASAGHAGTSGTSYFCQTFQRYAQIPDYGRGAAVDQASAIWAEVRTLVAACETLGRPLEVAEQEQRLLAAARALLLATLEGVSLAGTLQRLSEAAAVAEAHDHPEVVASEDALQSSAQEIAAGTRLLRDQVLALAATAEAKSRLERRAAAWETLNAGTSRDDTPDPTGDALALLADAASRTPSIVQAGADLDRALELFDRGRD